MVALFAFISSAVPKSLYFSRRLSHPHRSPCQRHSSYRHGEPATRRHHQQRKRVARVCCAITVPAAAATADDDDNKHVTNASLNQPKDDKSNTTRRDPVSLGYADEFDRDYYDDLKAEYADNPLVSIYSKDDYDLDDVEVDWLKEEFHERDLTELKKEVASRPVPEGLAAAPLRQTDLHSIDDVENFNARACEYDPTSGIPWENKPHDMHMYPDCEFSDLRHHEPLPEEEDVETLRKKLPFEPMKRKVISEEQEREELMVALNELEELDNEAAEENAPLYAPAGNVPSPTQEEMRRWSKAAEDRGGNAVVNPSFALPPMAPTSVGQQSTSEEEPPPVPPQYYGTVQAHLGRWSGEAEVLRLEWSRNSVSIVSRTKFEIGSDIDIEDDDTMSWETAVYCNENEDGESVDHVSSVDFATPDTGEELSPERAVFECGSYVAQITPLKDVKHKPLSLSSKCVELLTGGSTACIELCSKSGQDVTAERMRVIICGRKSGARGGMKKKTVNEGSDVIITHLIIIREKRGELKSVETNGKGGILRSTLSGKWRGRGLSLQPMYPQMASALLTSSQEWRERSDIEIADVTWTEGGVMEMRGERGTGSNLSTQGSKTQRRSRRVRAAAKHDSERLAKCGRICQDILGSENVETHAWALNADQATAYSPRLGKFVNDYFAIALTDTCVLIAPTKSAWPSLNNTVSIVDTKDTKQKRRRRLIANRSCEGQLVGALLLDEEAQ